MQEDSKLAQKAGLAPQDLVGIPLISCLSDPARSGCKPGSALTPGSLTFLPVEA